MAAPDQHMQKRRSQILDDETLHRDGFFAREYEDTWIHEDTWVTSFVARLARLVAKMGRGN